MDIGLACEFPCNAWCWLKDKSSLATHYDITIFGSRGGHKLLWSYLGDATQYRR